MPASGPGPTDSQLGAIAALIRDVFETGDASLSGRTFSLVYRKANKEIVFSLDERSLVRTDRIDRRRVLTLIAALENARELKGRGYSFPEKTSPLTRIGSNVQGCNRNLVQG